MSPQMFTGHYTSKGVFSFFFLHSSTKSFFHLYLNFQRHTTHIQTGDQITFLEQQKGSLPPPDVEEVNRLCREATESSVVECLGRRDACLRTVNTLIHSPDSSLFTPSCGPTGNIGTAADLLFLVVQSCLSICERNRAPFTVIGQILHCCCTSASIALSSSAPSEETLASVITRDQVDHTITQWLSSLAPAITSSTPPSASSPSQPPPSPTGLL
ncbi:hypothetical protein Pelo_17340 [Pelomyxa schiedti]|nr:hypothetical protein Pelo_17340 [Pelomyxa schiedti]